MKIDKNNSVYIIVYSVVMVVVVAAALAVAAMWLQPIQNENIAADTKGALLAAVGVNVPRKQVEAEYAKYITEIDVPAEDGETLPVFESTAGGKKLYIVPVNGKGLWGPVWGYVAVEEDFNTVSGVVFDHKSETPGLGAEITTPEFCDQFVGKKLFEGDQFVAITVLKGAGASSGNDHAVDAISGGTITSRAVENMIRATFEKYMGYIKERMGANPNGSASGSMEPANGEPAVETTEPAQAEAAQAAPAENIDNNKAI